MRHIDTKSNLSNPKTNIKYKIGYQRQRKIKTFK